MNKPVAFKDFDSLVELLGRDMEKLRGDMITLNQNQGRILDEIKEIKTMLLLEERK